MSTVKASEVKEDKTKEPKQTIAQLLEEDDEFEEFPVQGKTSRKIMIYKERNLEYFLSVIYTTAIIEKAIEIGNENNNYLIVLFFL